MGSNIAVPAPKDFVEQTNQVIKTISTKEKYQFVYFSNKEQSPSSSRSIDCNCSKDSCDCKEAGKD